MMRRTTFGHDLDRTQGLVSGHLDSAWITNCLQFDDQDDDSGFVGTPMPVVEQMRPFVAIGVDTSMLGCTDFPDSLFSRGLCTYCYRRGSDS